MSRTSNNREYLNKRLSGEEIVSDATIYGFRAMTNKAPETFVVIVLNADVFSFFKYKTKDGKFHVLEYGENKPHAVSSIINNDMNQNSKLMAWWKYVFFERDETYRYDPILDSYPISDNHKMTLKELTEKLLDTVSDMELPSDTTQVYLTGELSKNPALRYILQQKMSPAKIISLPEVNDEDIPEENTIVTMPANKLEQRLDVGGDVRLSSLVSDSVRITLPLDSADNGMVPGMKWTDILADTQKDYSVGNTGFKVITLSISCDSFQNVFLTCQDLRGNRKVKQL